MVSSVPIWEAVAELLEALPGQITSVQTVVEIGGDTVTVQSDVPGARPRPLPKLRDAAIANGDRVLVVGDVVVGPIG